MSFASNRTDCTNPRVTFHRPTGMLTVLAVRAVAGHGESLCLIEPTRNVPSPQWNVTCSAFGLQGGGLYIVGTATLTNTNVYSNQADLVCSLSALA